NLCVYVKPPARSRQRQRWPSVCWGVPRSDRATLRLAPSLVYRWARANADGSRLRSCAAGHTRDHALPGPRESARCLPLGVQQYPHCAVAPAAAPAPRPSLASVARGFVDVLRNGIPPTRLMPRSTLVVDRSPRRDRLPLGAAGLRRNSLLSRR